MGAFSHLPYRRGVGMMLINRDKNVFVAKRIDMTSEAWQMPQGGVDDGEDLRTAALRELEEETSIRNVEIVAESKHWLHYDLPDALVPKIWNGKYRGQEQKWYALRFLGEDSDINLETAHAEFSEWKWVAPYHLPDIIVPFKRDLYTQIVMEFSFLL